MRISKAEYIDGSGIGARIKAARKDHPFSLEALAAAANISRKYWYDIEAEKPVDLPIETLRGVEAALGKKFGVFE